MFKKTQRAKATKDNVTWGMGPELLAQNNHDWSLLQMSRFDGLVVQVNVKADLEQTVLWQKNAPNKCSQFKIYI